MAGLGLGMVLHALVAKPEVTEVLVVEINPNVIELIKPTIPEAFQRQAVQTIQAHRPNIRRECLALLGADPYRVPREIRSLFLVSEPE